jgi:excisionase family DNA binding protein
MRGNPMVADALMTVEEVAKYLKVEESTVYTWARQRKVPAIKIGRFWRFRKEDIDKWLEENKVDYPKERGKKWRN